MQYIKIKKIQLTKSILRGKGITLNDCIRKEERTTLNGSRYHFKKLEK